VERKCLFDSSGVIAWSKQERTINHDHTCKLVFHVSCALAGAQCASGLPCEVDGMARKIPLHAARADGSISPNLCNGLMPGGMLDDEAVVTQPRCKSGP